MTNFAPINEKIDEDFDTDNSAQDECDVDVNIVEDELVDMIQEVSSSPCIKKIVVAAIILLCCCGIIFYSYYKKNNITINILQQQKQLLLTQVETEQQRNKAIVSRFIKEQTTPISHNKNILVKWVVNHAKKTVPLQDIVLIVEQALECSDPLLILSVIDTESTFFSQAISSKGAAGLMQVRWSVWKDELAKINITSERQLFDIKTNIKAGSYILTKYINETGSVKKALGKYVGNSPKYINVVLLKYAELNILTNSIYTIEKVD